MNDKREIIKAELDKYLKSDKLDLLKEYNPYLYEQICKLSIDNIFVSEDAIQMENKYCFKHNEICYETKFLYCVNNDTPKYPVHSIFIDKKGNAYKTLLGWYTDKDEVAFNLDNIYFEPVYEKTHLFPKSVKREKIFKGIISALMPIPFIIVTIAIFAYYYS